MTFTEYSLSELLAGRRYLKSDLAIGIGADVVWTANAAAVVAIEAEIDRRLGGMSASERRATLAAARA